MKQILGVKRPLKLGVKRPGCETTGNHKIYLCLDIFGPYDCLKRFPKFFQDPQIPDICISSQIFWGSIPRFQIFWAAIP